MIPFQGYFWIRIVFPFFIHSGILAPSWHILNWRIILSWMDANFFKTRIHVCHHSLAFSVLSWPYLGVFKVSFLSPIFLFIHCQTCLWVCFLLLFWFFYFFLYFIVFFSLLIPVCFSFLGTFAFCCSFFTSPSSLISHPGLVFLFGFLRGTPILLQTNFAPE